MRSPARRSAKPSERELAARRDVARALGSLIASASLALACTVAPSPSVPLVDCGPLPPLDCTAAMDVVAKGAVAAGVTLTSLRIASPTPDHTCPPSGGLAGSHECAVIVIVSTTDGNLEIGLLRNGSGGWIDAATIR